MTSPFLENFTIQKNQKDSNNRITEANERKTSPSIVSKKKVSSNVDLDTTLGQYRPSRHRTRPNIRQYNKPIPPISVHELCTTHQITHFTSTYSVTRYSPATEKQKKTSNYSHVGTKKKLLVSRVISIIRANPRQQDPNMLRANRRTHQLPSHSRPTPRISNYTKTHVSFAYIKDGGVRPRAANTRSSPYKVNREPRGGKKY